MYDKNWGGCTSEHALTTLLHACAHLSQHRDILVAALPTSVQQNVKNFFKAENAGTWQ